MRIVTCTLRIVTCTLAVLPHLCGAAGDTQLLQPMNHPGNIPMGKT